MPSHDEWYTKLRQATSLSIHHGDLDSALENALRRRAKRDNFGLSIQLNRGEEATCTVSLFPKGEKGPGRKAYLERVRAKPLRHASEDCKKDGHDPLLHQITQGRDGRLYVRCGHCGETGELQGNVVWPDGERQ